MNLYDYLRKNLERQDPHPAIDHQLRATLHPDGRISFYIHAERRDSDTADFWVSDAGVFEKKEPMSVQAHFLTFPKAVRDAKMQAMADKLMEGPGVPEELLG
jgi:hypothetical protein